MGLCSHTTTRCAFAALSWTTTHSKPPDLIATYNMPGLQTDTETTEERLKAALWYSTGQTLDAVALNEDLNATPHFIGGLSEMIWAQIANVAGDLEAFAKHAGRTLINAKDVVLLGRRTEGLEELLRSRAKAIQDGQSKGR